MPGNPERPIYKIYPQLQGKSVFIIESPVERGDKGLIPELTDHLVNMQLMEVTTYVRIFFEGSLLQKINECNFDITVFHVAGSIEADKVLEAHEAGEKIIVLERMNAVTDELTESYNNLRKAGIPMCPKLGNAFEMTKKITDLMAQQFSEPTGTVLEGV